MQRVSKIKAVQLGISKSKPPKVLILAEGEASSSGWSNPALSPWFYIAPPEDGILDFDFVATPPKGISLTVMSPVSASLVVPRDPADFWGKGKPLNGVRIHAANNKKEGTFGPALATLGDDSPYPLALLGGDASPWPWNRKIPRPDLRGKRVDPQQLVIDLIGAPLRVYRTGDGLTLDYVSDRVNIEIAPDTGHIVDIWNG